MSFPKIRQLSARLVFFTVHLILHFYFYLLFRFTFRFFKGIVLRCRRFARLLYYILDLLILGNTSPTKKVKAEEKTEEEEEEEEGVEHGHAYHHHKHKHAHLHHHHHHAPSSHSRLGGWSALKFRLHSDHHSHSLHAGHATAPHVTTATPAIVRHHRPHHHRGAGHKHGEGGGHHHHHHGSNKYNGDFLHEIENSRVLAVCHSKQKGSEWFGLDFERYHHFQGVLKTRFVDSLIYNNHLNTILASAKPELNLPYDREFVHSFDGCELGLDWMYYRNKPVHKRCRGVIVILPGLGNHSQTNYIGCFVKHATEGGRFHCCVLNARGFGDTRLTKPQPMHGALTNDIRHVANNLLTPDQIATRFGRTLPVFAIGFSLGGNVLAKYLGEEGIKAGSGVAVALGHHPNARQNITPFKAAACVSAPWDLHETSQQLSAPISKLIYDTHMARELLRYAVRHADVLSELDTFDIESLKRTCWTLLQYETHVTLPTTGCSSSEEFMSKAMCFPFLAEIPLPVLCFSTMDDPITGAPPKRKRWERISKVNPNVVLVTVPGGGHLGFLQDPWRELTQQPNFMEQFVVSSLAHFAENC